MSKTLTIQLSDADYEAVRVAAERAKQSPEQLIAETIAERFGQPRSPDASFQESKNRLLALMRAHGHLVEPRNVPPQHGGADLPPYGSAEEAQLMREIGDELSDALEQSGLSILDLIERR